MPPAAKHLADAGHAERATAALLRFLLCRILVILKPRLLRVEARSALVALAL
jgi:hypothetical protein